MSQEAFLKDLQPSPKSKADKVKSVKQSEKELKQWQETAKMFFKNQEIKNK